MNDDSRNYFDERFSALATKEDFKGHSEDLDYLAAITKRGFDDVDKRFDQWTCASTTSKTFSSVTS